MRHHLLLACVATLLTIGVPTFAAEPGVANAASGASASKVTKAVPTRPSASASMQMPGTAEKRSDSDRPVPAAATGVSRNESECVASCPARCAGLPPINQAGCERDCVARCTRP
jgi:hypothetical protein